MYKVDLVAIIHDGYLLNRVPDFQLLAQDVHQLIAGGLVGGADDVHVVRPLEREHAEVGLKHIVVVVFQLKHYF